MFVIDDRSVHMVCRDLPWRTSVLVSESAPLTYLSARVVGNGTGIRAVAAGPASQLIIYSDNEWDSQASPSRQIAGVVMGRYGKIYVAGREWGLHREGDETWSSRRYPAGLGSVHSIAEQSDGEIVLAGSRGIYTYLRGTFFPKQLSQAITGVPRDMWVSPRDTLWLVTDRQLVAVTKRGKVTTFNPPNPERIQHVTGMTTIYGEVLALTSTSQLTLFDGIEFRAKTRGYAFPEDYRGHGWKTVSDQRIRRGLTYLAAEPSASVPRIILADTKCPLTARAHETPTPTRESIPVVRVGLGVGFGQQPDGPRKARFAREFMVGGSVGQGPRWALFPEVGYSSSGLSGSRSSQFLGGLGLLWGTWSAAVGVVPRLAVGTSAGQFAVGSRLGVMGSFLYDSLALEVAHQWLRVGGRNLHEGRVLASLNLVSIGALLGVFVDQMAWKRRLRRHRNRPQ